MPTSRQRRAAERRRLQRQALRRTEAGGVIDKVAKAGTKERSSDGQPRLPLSLRAVTVG